MMDLSSVLAFAPRHELLEVRQIVDPGLRAHWRRAGLREGGRCSCSETDPQHLLVTTDGGRRVRIGIHQALFVLVEPGTVS